MAVYKHGYTRYDGPLTSHRTRLMVLPKFAWQQLASERLMISVLVAAMFWPIACALFVYVANRADLLAGFGELPDFLRVDSTFFQVFMGAQSVFAIVLAALVGPGLIAPDLSNGALPLYFSRPLSRTEYVVARMMALVGILSVVTWVPGLFLFLMQTGMAGWDWFAGNWRVGLGLFFGFLLWILLVGLVALACSAYVKWRVLGGALVLAVFFVMAGAAELTNEILRVQWAAAFNPARAMDQVWRSMLGLDPAPGPGTTTCVIALALMVVALILVIERRLRPVQVVS
jgi:ABC-2 type transport system permease protein